VPGSWLVHRFSTAIQLDGDTATGRAYIQELARTSDGRQALNYAIYHDRHQRTPDGWKFAERVYEVRYADHSPLAACAIAALGAGVPGAPASRPGAAVQLLSAQCSPGDGASLSRRSIASMPASGFPNPRLEAP
jgi:SnoaL-like domain